MSRSGSVEEAREAGGERVLRWLPATLLLVGIALRLRAYFAGRSLWLDELLLWTTLGEPDPLRFLEPLGEGQVAAPGFVLLIQLVRGCFGDGEFVLRAVPLLCGVAALPLLHRLASRLFPPGVAALALAALAVSPAAIYFSSDFKPYTLDLCVAIGLLLATASDLERGPRSARLAPLGFLAVFVSLPSAIVLAGAATVWVLAARRQPRFAAIRAACAFGFAALFAVQYLLVLRHHHADPEIAGYWHGLATFPADDGIVAALRFAPEALLRALSDPAGFGDEWGRVGPSTWLAAALFVVGVRRLATTPRGRLALALLGAPLLVALLAALLRLYPFGGRVLLFLLPALILPVAAGFTWLILRVAAGRARVALTLGLALILFLEPGKGAWRRFQRPYAREETRPVLEELHREVMPGDLVYLTWFGTYAFRYYAPRIGQGELAEVEAVASAYVRDEAIELRVDDFLAKTAGRGRVWLFASHFYPENDTLAALLEGLEARGVERGRSFSAPAAAVHLLAAP
jgi:hypothetical protein